MHDLDQGGGRPGERSVENIRRTAQCCRPVTQQAAGDRGQTRVPLGDDAWQLRQACGPLVATLQPEVVRLARAADRLALRGDVALRPPGPPSPGPVPPPP